MGLPPSGGFVGKWLLLTSSLASLEWWWALVVMTGSLLASIYVFKVIFRFFVIPAGFSFKKPGALSPLLEWPALALALISLFLGLAAPWPLYILARGSTALTRIFPGGLP